MAAPEVVSTNSVTNKMMRPPAITPNYGKKKSVMPKTCLPKVVLHDNVTQEQMLQAKLAGIKLDRKRTTRMLELSRRSFIIQQSLKQEQLRSAGHHVKFVSDELVQTHLTMSKFRTAKTPAQPTRSKTVLPEFEKTGSAFVTKLYPDVDFHPPVETMAPVSRTASAEEPIRRRESAKNVNRLTSTLPALRSQSAFDTTTGWRAHSVKSHALRKEKTFAHCGEYNRSHFGVKDPRFVLLQNVLIPSDRPTAGFIQLSPCYGEVLDRYRKNILRNQRAHTDSRACSSRKRSALVRSAKRATASNLISNASNHDSEDSDSDTEVKG